MALTQTVDIPADRRVFIDIPREISTGKARVLIFPVVENNPSSKGNKKIGMTKAEISEFLKNAETPISDSLTGIFAKVGDITKEQIREARLSEKYPECFI